ncbi:hypothetical protein WN944_006857 [Citrus x changshan-huyou]|uniref:PIPK domain-containing protein n=1 Tax=Citrus x changshan-huyou TaxID=2935761 RepID=A0AAP0MLT8_9ROSI
MACIGLSQLETFVFGNQTCFIVMGNLFCSGYRIHRHFALKGSSHGRSVGKLNEIVSSSRLRESWIIVLWLAFTSMTKLQAQESLLK